jgi:hypothetical protein
MTPAQQEAKELIELFTFNCRECDNAKEAALKCVQRIILANPHSNPFNTDAYSTMDYWLKVQEEIKKG